MNLSFMQVTEADLPQYKKDMQEAFQFGAIEGGFPMNMCEIILPEKDIDRSLASKGAVAYKAMSGNDIVGGAIVVLEIDKSTGHLDFLYVKHGVQNKGIGKFIWFEIERLHPEIHTWETCTPYFEKRNLHFYINVCGFHVTEYWNEHFKAPQEQSEEYDEQYIDGSDDGDGMFCFRKEIKHTKKVNTPIEIKTERLIIRQFKNEDLQSYYRLIANPRVNCFRDVKYCNIDDAKKELIKMQENEDASELAVALKECDKFIGHLFGMWEDDTFSVGWNFLAEYCGKGYAYESAKAYFDYLFNELDARRIYAYTEDNNIQSQKLCEKLGMRKEGLFKEFISFVSNADGTPHYENTYQWAILKKEWNK